VVVSDTLQITIDVTPTNIILCCSGRIVRAPDRFIGVANVAISDELEYDPSTYNEVINDVDANHWVKSMKSELESIYSNNVWSLVKASNGIKSIDCKWVYQRKRVVDIHQEGIDYKETFSLFAMLKSIRILLSIAAHFDYEIRQMNIKTAFLNEQLDEDIYMMQPDGFIANNQEDMVCKLQRSIFGFKQASRSWNIRFDETIKQFGFEQNLDEPCVYKKCQR
jgi:hypothetical protein